MTYRADTDRLFNIILQYTLTFAGNCGTSVASYFFNAILLYTRYRVDRNKKVSNTSLQYKWTVCIKLPPSCKYLCQDISVTFHLAYKNTQTGRILFNCFVCDASSHVAC